VSIVFSADPLGRDSQRQTCAVQLRPRNGLADDSLAFRNVPTESGLEEAMNELQRSAITHPAARAHQVNPGSAEHFKALPRSPYGATVGLTVNR
jgi:hypothetical protein